MAAIQFTEATKAYPRTIAPAGKYPIVGDRIYRTLQDAQDYVDGKSSSKSAIPGIYLSVIDDGINNGAYWVEQAAGYDGATVGVLRKMGAGGGGGGDISLAWDDITGKPSFADVATSGSYNDLTDKPTIPSLDGYATQQWVSNQGFAVATSLGALAYKGSLSWSEIVDRPTKLSNFTNDAGFITSAALAGYLKEEDAETIYITEEEAEDRYVKRGGDSINGDISFGGSIKIGGATLSWDEASHALKVDTSFYSTKQLASGGIGDASGSGLGLILNEWPTDSEDYSKYALGGNLGIELNTRLTAVEGKATNVTVSPTLSQGKPMGTIMVDGVSQTMYAPASYSADDIVPTQERNFVSLQDIEYWNTAYLPKTGGTLKGSLVPDKDGAYHLGSSSYRMGVVFALQGVFYGGLSINNESVATQTWADGRYLKLSGGAISGNIKIESGVDRKIILDNTDTDNKYQFISFRQNGTEYGQLGTAFSDDLVWGKEGYEKIILHSGNIGSYNAGSATKLADDTAFTVWGQKFFENGKPKSISMNTDIQARILYFRNKNNDNYAGYVGRGDPNADDVILFGRTNLKFYTNSTTRMLINSSGNVTIGASDLAGTTTKLYVEGNMLAVKLTTNTEMRLYAENSLARLGILVAVSGNRGIYDYTTDAWVIATNGTNTWLAKGNVGIGTTSPAYKLDVNGTSGLKQTYFHHTTETAANKGAFLLQYYNTGTNDILALTSRTGSNLAYKSNILTVDWATGNVGIGEIHSPQYKLDVHGSSRLARDGSANSAIANATNFTLDTTTTGGWDRTFRITNNGTTMFTFGAFGSGDSLTYGYVGGTYSNPWVSFDSEKVQFNRNIRIGNAILSYDWNAGALKIEGNVYATGQVASGGIGTAVATIASDHEDRIAQLEAKVESLMS